MINRGLAGCEEEQSEALNFIPSRWDAPTIIVTVDPNRRVTLPAKAGQRMPVEDNYIAATARKHGLTITTGNDKDFRRPGLKVFNSFKDLHELA
jgi:predicted nucleic acid-binding protein